MHSANALPYGQQTEDVSQRNRMRRPQRQSTTSMRELDSPFVQTNAQPQVACELEQGWQCVPTAHPSWHGSAPIMYSSNSPQLSPIHHPSQYVPMGMMPIPMGPDVMIASALSQMPMGQMGQMPMARMAMPPQHSPMMSYQMAGYPHQPLVPMMWADMSMNESMRFSPMVYDQRYWAMTPMQPDWQPPHAMMHSRQHAEPEGQPLLPSDVDESLRQRGGRSSGGRAKASGGGRGARRSNEETTDIRSSFGRLVLQSVAHKEVQQLKVNASWDIPWGQLATTAKDPEGSRVLQVRRTC